MTAPRTWRAPLSDDAVRSYVEDGFLVVEDLVSPVEVEELREDAERFARGDYPVANPEAAPAAGDEEAGGLLCVHFPHWVSPVARRAVVHEGVAGVVRRIAGAHLAHWDGSAKCMQSMLFVKPPGLPGQAWHQDERYIPTRDRSLVGAWIALDAATEENGCLRVLPGSHRSGYLWPTRGHGRPEEFDPSDEAHGFDAEEEVIVPARAGSVVFFHGYLLHRSLRNRSAVPRRALVNHYCNAWSLLPWMPAKEIHGSEVPTLDNRMVVPLGDDPYAWKGYRPAPRTVFLRAWKPGEVRRSGGS